LNRQIEERAARIDALLPQTQCRLCGYAGCRPYAVAIAQGKANINQCPPGGDEGARELAAVAGVPYAALDGRFGPIKLPAVAVIDESICIGCTLCIEACPVDAIAGAAKLMHTVIASHCTGCELCLAPCPVNCISLRPVRTRPTREERRAAAADSKLRFDRRTARLAREQFARRSPPPGDVGGINRETVQRAILRARRRLAERGPSQK
jgi:Na+-translocating ferredoxin:NAD+ oxidoreductase subunit B